MAVFLTPFGLWMSVLARRLWRESRTHPRPALLRKYHRRYVVPSADLDQEAAPTWLRALSAADTITGADVVREQRADWDRLSSVLPDWLWEIAERLALLSEVRARQSEVLRGLTFGAPEAAEILDRQRRAQDMAIEDIDRRVRRLQVLAGWATTADGTIRKLRAIQQLTVLNDAHADLLARVDHTGVADAHEAEALVRDLQAIVEQADEAVRQAIEAADSLTLPDE
jgi:hypothetical protein